MLSSRFIIFLFLGLIAFTASQKIPNDDFSSVECPSDWTINQSDEVKNNFDLSKIDGFWYEIAYHDLAQVKETCQYLNRSVSSDLLSMDEAFGFTYPNRSGELLLHYDVTGKAIFNRYIDKPIVRKFQIPSAVVDLTMNKDGSYDTISEYLCYAIGPITYREIRILSRQNTMNPLTLKKLEDQLHNLGIPFKMLRQADHSNCTYGL